MDYVLKKPAELTESEIARWIALQEADMELRHDNPLAILR